MSLAGLQALDLSDVEQPSSNGVQHRHIFVAGRCLDPELSDTELTWSAAKSVFTLTAHRKNTSGYHVEVREYWALWRSFFNVMDFGDLNFCVSYSWMLPVRSMCIIPGRCTKSPRGCPIFIVGVP